MGVYDLGKKPQLDKKLKLWYNVVHRERCFPLKKDIYTTEQILEKCPSEIFEKDIPLKKIGGYHAQKNPHHAGRAVANRQRKGRSEALYFKEETRIKAACVYAITGSAAKTGEILGIKPGTIRQWKLQPWWQQVIDRIKSEKDDELDVKLTQIIDKSMEVINDRLENGDFIYDVRSGELVRKPMGGKETAVVTSIMVDKQTLIRGRKQIRKAESEVMDRLKNLVSEFEKMGRSQRAKDITNEVEIIDVTDEEEYKNAKAGDSVQESDTQLSTEKEVIVG